MSATTMTPTTRDRVGWGDLAWVTWRQHRLMIVGTCALALAVAGAMVALWLYAGSLGDNGSPALSGTPADSSAELVVFSLMGYGVLVAAFWAAPLLTREYEQGTHILAWSQDVTAARWLIGKVVPLAVIAVLPAILVGTLAGPLIHQINAVSEYPRFQYFSGEAFEAVPHLQAAYALFGFALGLALSAICRRTVLSMGLTLGVFVVFRAVVATLIRPHYQTPERSTTPLESESGMNFSNHALHVDSGLLNAAGEPMDYPEACQVGFDSSQGYNSCLRDNGAVRYFEDFQPPDRLGTFQLIEFGIYTCLAAALFVAAWAAVRRVTRL